MRKKLLGIITARGGSKGLPNKNIKILNGRPLIAHTIEAALKTKLFDQLIVSTDSRKIARIAKRYGAQAPFLRPKSLARDTSKSMDVVIHVMNWLEARHIKYDYVMLLQPTSPLRSAEDIVKAWRMLDQHKMTSVISVMPSPYPPTMLFTLVQKNFVNPVSFRLLHNKQRQGFSQFYKINGAIYLASWEQLMKKKSWYSPRTKAYIMPREKSLDIDDELDFFLASCVARRKHRPRRRI
jgi:CMP-N,N'-diacetyllegionaminic acid synthase